MPFDFKKQFRDQYQPSRTPGIVSVPAMRYVAVRGRGNPNEEGGAYQRAIELLYGVSYTIKMSPKAGHAIDGYFEYVVSPLEGFWWQEGVQGVDYARKDDFNWISCIRLPDFVTPDEFAWAIDEATRKKRRDFSSVELLSVEEGTCVQCLHLGPYDDEPATVDAMHAVAEEQGYVPDFSNTRLHHEIYLSDPRRTAPDKLKTVIRHPVRRA
ncbi:MAG: GyrI-like domain-containing protein [Atopobiaceae bacterium]|nr:GyrI-like domain-containing protein [Atopobiaceae bacterium]